MSLWLQVANVALGLWLMAAPEVLGYDDPMRSNHHVVGPLVVSFATVAIWEATRGVGRVNFALGAWLVVAPLVLGAHGVALANSLAAGILVIACEVLSRGNAARFGGGWSALFRS